MITDYTVLPIADSKIESVIMWDRRCWLNHKQLQRLLHVNKGKLERMISKLSVQMSIHGHQEIFSIVKFRRQEDGGQECIYQIRHYDEEVLEQLVRLKAEKDAVAVMLILEKLKTEVMQDGQSV